MTSSAITPEIIDSQVVNLSSATTKGLSDWEIETMETSVADINEHLGAAGNSLRYVAAELSTIKKNVKKSANWNAFLESGVLSCSPKFASDLVAAHDKWLCTADVEDAVIAQLSPRSLAAMANRTEPERQKVYKMISTADKKTQITEAKVRACFNKKKPAKGKGRVVDNSPDAKLERQIALNKELESQNRKLRAENAELRKQLSNKVLGVEMETVISKR
tara:strand:+ start:832 stop:1488 length:657 start_codon:yes stop_codon:yes gene_type:complete